MPSERASENTWSQEDRPRPQQTTPRDPHEASDKNRRNHPRFRVDGATISLYREGLLTALGLGRSNKGRAALDLSETGARVLVTEHLAPGAKVRLKIDMEKYKDSIEVEGVVRWCVPTKKDFQAGIMFSETGQAVRRKIAAMHDWFASPEYKAVRQKRLREKGYLSPE